MPNGDIESESKTFSPKDVAKFEELGWFRDLNLFLTICQDLTLVPANKDFETWVDNVLRRLKGIYSQHWTRNEA